MVVGTRYAFERSSIAGLYRPEVVSTSIGPVGFVGLGGSKRVKGFLDFEVNSRESLLKVVDVVQYGISIVNKTIEREGFGEVSRLSARAVVSKDYLSELSSKLIDIGATLEATLPMHNGYRNDVIAYIGFNRDDRCVSNSDMQRFHSGLKDAENVGKIPGEKEHRLEAVSNAGYDVQVFDGATVKDAAAKGLIDMGSVIRLMEDTYSYRREDAERVITGSDNVLSVVTHKVHGVVAMCILESTLVRVDGEDIRIAERTDGVVRPDHRGDRMGDHMGAKLFLAVTNGILERHVRTNIGRYDALFLEANLSKRSVAEAEELQSAEFGMEFRGILPNHVEIGGGLASLAVRSIDCDAPKKLLRGRVGDGVL